MKRYFLSAVLFGMMTSLALAVPYASRIQLGSTLVIPGTGTSISYFLNQPGTVQIEIVDAATATTVAATFAGTGTQGSNVVVWDGTVDNAGGAAVAEGSYRVRITVDATAAAGWVEIASNSSLGNYVPGTNATIYQTLWDGFSGMESLISQNPDEDAFGYILTSTSYSTPRVDGHVVFNTDLSILGGGDGQSTWLNFPDVAANNQAVWGNCFDPEDPTKVWVVGQSGAVNVMTGDWNAPTLTDVTNGDTNVANARDIAVRVEGSSKYAYITNGSSQLWKCDVSTGVVTSSENILGLADTARYSKGADVDAAGNLYWTSRYNNSSTGEGGVVLRWSAAQADAATAGSLTEANAEWNISFPTGSSNIEGVTIDPDGNVYAAVINEGGLGSPNDGSLRGIYLLGNTATASNVKTLTLTDRIYAYYGDSSFFSTFGHGIAADFAGNLYYTDRSSEMIRAIGPEGTTSIEVLAPLSQNLEIAYPPAAASFWSLYE